MKQISGYFCLYKGEMNENEGGKEGVRVSKGFEIMDGFALMTADSKFQNEFIQVC
jgi:hypothetical protein